MKTKKFAAAVAVALSALSVNPPETSASISNALETSADIPEEAASFNGHHYLLIDVDSATWLEAHNFCKSHGGHLATITSSDEQNFISNLIQSEGYKNNYWIGGYKDRKGTWRWITNEKFAFTAWASDEPNNFRDQENCLMMYGPSHSQVGLWNDIRSDGFSRDDDTFFLARNFGIICEWDY